MNGVTEQSSVTVWGITAQMVAISIYFTLCPMTTKLHPNNRAPGCELTLHTSQKSSSLAFPLVLLLPRCPPLPPLWQAHSHPHSRWMSVLCWLHDPHVFTPCPLPRHTNPCHSFNSTCKQVTLTFPHQLGPPLSSGAWIQLPSWHSLTNACLQMLPAFGDP